MQVLNKLFFILIDIYIIMIKIYNILQEIYLNEKIIKVPIEIINKSREAFRYIKQNIDDIKKKATVDDDNPHIPIRLKNFFKLKDLKGNDIMVSIGFYNNPDDIAAARMDSINNILLINLVKLKLDDLEDFEEVIEHELVHSMDPKHRNKQLFTRLYRKSGAKPDEDLDKYYKSPWEFDAYTAPLIRTIRYNLNKVENEDEYKEKIFNLLYDIKTKSVEEIINNEKYELLSLFFSKKEWDAENYDAIMRLFVHELNKIKIWSKRPTLYKRFLKRLAQELLI